MYIRKSVFFWKLFWISGKVLFLGTFSRYPEKCLLSPPFLDISRKGAGKKETFPEIQKRCWKCVFFPAPFLNIRKSVFFQHLFRLFKKGTFSGTCPVYPETCLFSWNFFWNIRKSIVFKMWIYLKCDTWQYMVCSFLNLDIQETNIWIQNSTRRYWSCTTPMFNWKAWLLESGCTFYKKGNILPSRYWEIRVSCNCCF